MLVTSVLLLCVLAFVLLVAFAFACVEVVVGFALIALVHTLLFITHVVRSWAARLRGHAPTHRA